jgi:transposase
MLITTLLNRCHHFPGFVYEQARLADEGDSILIPIRPRKGTAAICSGCHQPAAGYDQARKARYFEFIGVWGFLVFLVYFMRRVDCKGCGITVEEVPWGMGKHSSTRVYMHFLGHWARKLSWKETAESFHTTWDKVHDSVSYLVAYGLEHRVLGVIRAIGVDEVQYAKGHKYLTLVYQIEAGCIRLLWIGQERTVKTLTGISRSLSPPSARAAETKLRQAPTPTSITLVLSDTLDRRFLACLDAQNKPTIFETISPSPTTLFIINKSGVCPNDLSVRIGFVLGSPDHMSYNG